VLEAFKEHISKTFPELLANPFLLACSGGLDSIVLTHLCHITGLEFLLAHCNFRLRGAESDGDEEFVQELAKKLYKKYFVTHFDTIGYVNKNKVSVQMAARELRYHWFSEIMRENDIKTLVTAHHGDDNLETFLINLSRGTGIDGLTGIPAKTNVISRPLLRFSRDELESYAKSEGLQWREDSSNSETKYLRNNIRHEIIPLLKKLHPTFLLNFNTTQELLNQTSVIASNHIQEVRDGLFRNEDGVVKIEIKALQELNPLKAYLYGFFTEYGFTEWDDVEHLLTAMSGKEVRSKTHRLVKDREYLLLTTMGASTNEVFTITENQTAIEEPLHFSIREVTNIEEQGKNVLFVDKETLKYPLTLRKWQKGDYFYPLGMQGKKKLSKFFKDEKVDVISKHKQWLLCSEEQIVWVVGRRADERFKVTDTTKNIVKISWVK